MKLRNHVAKCCDVQLVAFGDVFQRARHAADFGRQLCLLDLIEVDDFDRTVATLMAGGSDPVITKKPEGAYSFAIYDAMKK